MTTDLHRADPTASTDAHDVVVVGSGLAGLTAAATASRAGATVALVEGPATDGRARTDQRDGFLLNRGPHAVYDGGPGRAVLERLGISLDGVRPPADTVVARDALITRSPGEEPVVWTMETGRDGLIVALRLVLAPEKLTALEADALEW